MWHRQAHQAKRRAVPGKAWHPHLSRVQHCPAAVQPADAAVWTKDLRVEFGVGSAKRMVLKGVDFQVKRGSLHMLLGPNGCGKASVLTMCEKAVDGSVECAEQERG